MPDSPATFDHQADSFDERAGLDDAAVRAVARAVVDHLPAKSDGWILEVGAGTGEIGVEIAASGCRYLGFDLSLPMLRQFAHRIRSRGFDERLFVADGNRPWPVADGRVGVVFGSRSLHLLPADLVADEFRRVARPGASLLIGRTERQDSSVRSRMRRRMRELMRERGLRARRGDAHRRSLIDVSVERGARRIAPATVATWSVKHTARQSIHSWKQTGGLGGITPTADEKNEILRELGDFAQEAFGGLDVAIESEERYVIEGTEFVS